jgi:inner membrane protein involved in colicin E2 resistance
VNYLLIAAAFFSFHLLFAYSVDHISVEAAFAICSVVSVVLVVSYLRLVVSTLFAFREAALAQLVYLVGFSLAHFWEGYTGLTITVMAIVTLFVMMQLTGRVRWHEVLSFKNPLKAAEPQPFAGPVATQ